MGRWRLVMEPDWNFIFFQTACGKSFDVVVRFDTEVDLTYYRNGGILNYMIRKMLD